MPSMREWKRRAKHKEVRVGFEYLPIFTVQNLFSCSENFYFYFGRTQVKSVLASSQFLESQDLKLIDWERTSSRSSINFQASSNLRSKRSFHYSLEKCMGIAENLFDLCLAHRFTSSCNPSSNFVFRIEKITSKNWERKLPWSFKASCLIDAYILIVWDSILPRTQSLCDGRIFELKKMNLGLKIVRRINTASVNINN